MTVSGVSLSGDNKNLDKIMVDDIFIVCNSIIGLILTIIIKVHMMSIYLNADVRKYNLLLAKTVHVCGLDSSSKSKCIGPFYEVSSALRSNSYL